MTHSGYVMAKTTIRAHKNAGSLTMRVIDYVFGYIQEHQLSPGASLPSELQLSAEMKISRGTVREAFRSLEVVGVISKSNGRAPRVGPVDSHFLTQSLVHAISTRQLSQRQVLEACALIETVAVRSGVLRLSTSNTREIRLAVAGMKRSLGDPEAFVRHEYHIHDILNKALSNPLIRLFCSAMHESMRLAFLNAGGRVERMAAVKIHSRVADAIENRNTLQLGILIKNHFDEERRKLLTIR